MGAAATLAVVILSAGLLTGSPGRALLGARAPGSSRRAPAAPAYRQPLIPDSPAVLASRGRAAWLALVIDGVPLAGLALGGASTAIAVLAISRTLARRRRRYVRLRVGAYRTDRASHEALVAMFEALHKRLLCRWWRRLWRGQPSLALEVHISRVLDGVAQTPIARGAASRTVSDVSAGSMVGWLAVCCPAGAEAMVESAMRHAYPNLSLARTAVALASPRHLLRLKKRSDFIARVRAPERLELEEPSMNRLLTAMSAGGSSATVQIALTPAPATFERWARHAFLDRERRMARGRERRLGRAGTRSQVEDAELRGGLDVQHRPLFFADLRVLADSREACEQIASELRAEGAENRLVERGTGVRQGLLGLYGHRVARGEGNPIPSMRRGVLASTELSLLWQLPSLDYATVPFARAAVPVAPAPPAVLRPQSGPGALRDALGPVSIHPEMRRQNTAVPGTVEQGKTSYLVATVAEDLQRERCAVIVLDPKGDAADAALSAVPRGRTCTLLDFAHPTCGFNPLEVDAPADVIADYVVAALRNLFTDADIRASSDRYLRNAIIAVLAADRGASLWDAARLLSVGEEGYSYRARVGAQVRGLPEFKEISEFFTAELSAQLADARSMTTAKLDAPVNKLARLLNSTSIKRVLLNDSLRVDFDRVIAEREVLVVKGALGAMGAGNTSVLMQLLVGMLDAALGRQQDAVDAGGRVSVALKVDEAPLVLNRGFAETLALKRSAGLETVACWQTDAQWVDRDVRDSLDALFAHRVYFATASVRDARTAASLMMAEFADTVRSNDSALSALGRPDVRLHLPKHHAVVSWTTPAGRQPPFVARTLPLSRDPTRLAHHLAVQAARGGRYLADLRQPHWEESVTRAQRDVSAGATRAERDPQSPETSAAVAGPAEPVVAGRGASSASTADAGRTAQRVEPSLAASASEAPAEQPLDSYRELAAIDAAPRLRRPPAPAVPRRLDPDELDLEILAFVARMGHALSTQVHRRYNARRALTTTQRRLKRLADAGWIERLQFHRSDGGGVPMCCAIGHLGRALLEERGMSVGPPPEASTAVAHGGESAERRARARAGGQGQAAQARHEVHVTGWLLASERVLAGHASVGLRGASECRLSPSVRGGGVLGPADLRLPGGRTPHDFLTTAVDGRREPASRFETVRPDGGLELTWTDGSRPGMDLLLELDGRLPRGSAARKLERYDHMVSGWALQTQRYARRLGSAPAVVFVCRDASRARACAREADRVLTACQAYAGEYPADWHYPGRQLISFAAERDVHQGHLAAWVVPALPPEVRQAAAGDPSAAACEPELRDLATERARHGS